MTVSVQLEIAQNLRDVVETVLRTPRRNYSKYPEEEHAEDLRAYGDAILPVLAELMVAETPDQGYAAYTTLFHEGVKAAPWIISRMPQMSGQPLGMALDAYTQMALKDPRFPYRNELREAVLQLIGQKETWGAIEALGKLGTQDDIPLLESIYSATLGSDQSSNLVRESSNAALARLGVKDNIEVLEKELAIPVKAPGDETNFRFAAERAIYADRKELVPYLCMHVHDPQWWFGDYGVYPAADAVAAIVAIEHKGMTQNQIAAVCKTDASDPSTGSR